MQADAEQADVGIDGYYWCRHNLDGGTFIVLREDGLWYIPGVEHPVLALAETDAVIGMVYPPRRNGLQ